MSSSLLLPAPGLAQEVRTTGRLALPLVIGHVSAGLVGFVDNIIAGHHGTATLAAVTTGTALMWLPLMVPIGTLVALAAAVSHHDGAGEHARIGPLFRQAMWLAAGLGVAMFAFLSAAPYALAPMGIAPEIVPGARDFLLGIRWGLPAMAMFLCMRNLSEGMHWTLPTMVLGFGGLLLLAPLGYGLAFGRWGLPALGAGGLGVASAVTMWVQMLLFLAYLARARKFAALGLFARFEPPRWSQIAPLLRTGLPIGVTVLLEGGLFISTALLIARLGAVPAAAHQIAINLSAICFMVPMGLAEATTVRVGHALGRRDGAGVLRAVRAGYAIVLCTQGLGALVLALFHNQIAAIYTNDMAVAGLAGQLLVLAAIFQFPDGIQVMSAGALRGLRDTRVPMLLAAISYWGIGMPLGAGLGLGLGYGPRGMWVGLTIGLTVASILMGLRLRYSSRRLAGLPAR